MATLPTPELVGYLNPYNAARLLWDTADSATEIFTESGTFDNPGIGTFSLLAIGGGGGGNSSGNSGYATVSGGGGGSGGLTIANNVASSSISSSVNVTVGTGGAGGTDGGYGGTGTSTWIGGTRDSSTDAYVLANPGEGENGDNSSIGGYGASKGSASVGTSNIVISGVNGASSPSSPDYGPGLAGTAGSDGGPGSGGSGGAPGAGGDGGAGSGTYGGSGGTGGTGTAGEPDSTAGLAATDYGGGGGGGGATDVNYKPSQSPVAGGAGAPGVAVITITLGAPTSYNVYRNGTLLGNVSTASYIDPDLAPGTYTYDVYALYDEVESPESNTVTLYVGTSTSSTSPQEGMLFDYPVFEALDASQLVGAQLYFYESGTTTHQLVYADGKLEVALPQPVVADASGKFPAIFLDPNNLYNYRVQLYSYEDDLLSDTDPYVVPFAESTTAFLADSFAQALFTSTTSGTVPASGGGTSSYLCADGSWTQPFPEPAVFTSQANGIVPLAGPTSTNFLRADATWQDLGGTNDTAVLAPSGYWQSATSFVMQWGSFPTPVNADVSITFAIEFPTSCFAVITSQGESSGYGYPFTVEDITTSGFTAKSADDGQKSGTCYFIATGY